MKGCGPLRRSELAETMVTAARSEDKWDAKLEDGRKVILEPAMSRRESGL